MFSLWPAKTENISLCYYRSSSVDAFMKMDMYLPGVSVQRAENITEALLGKKVSPGTIINWTGMHIVTKTNQVFHTNSRK